MSKQTKLTRLRKKAMFSFCVYCGEKAPSRFIGDINLDASFEHLLNCPERPEGKLMAHVEELYATLKYLHSFLSVVSTDNTDELAECLRVTWEVLKKYER
jgi:hypothetical protein